LGHLLAGGTAAPGPDKIDDFLEICLQVHLAKGNRVQSQDVPGNRQITLGPAPTMGSVADIPLWLCFVVAAVFAAFGMNLALRAFKRAIR